MPSNYGKSLNYQVAPAKTGLISRGENHSLSWQFLHMHDRKRAGSRQSSLLLRVPSTNRDLCQQGTRIIAGASYEIRSADVLRTLDWDNLETRWYLTKATFLYKFLSNSAAPILNDSFTSRNILLNDYNLRNSQTDLTLPKPNREFLKRSFKYCDAYLWNNLPLEAKQAQSIYIFKSCIK